jgi:hypothetical protein
MKSDSDEVLCILRELVPKMKDCKDHVTGQMIGNCLFGLKNMSCNEYWVRLVLEQVVYKINVCKYLDPQAIGNTTTPLHHK